MPAAKKPQRKQRGSVDELPSGALRVRVYAGKDPVTKRRHDLVEVIPPGPRAQKDAEAALTRLLNQVDEKRHPRTSATVNQLLDRHLETLDIEPSTRTTYVGYLNNHVRPFVGHLKVGALDAEGIDSLTAEMRRCRRHCPRRSRGLTDHRTPQAHECDERCRQHVCRPLSNSSVRQVLFVLSGAYEKAIRWRWVSLNPVAIAGKPSAPAPDPQPPRSEDAARIVNEAWRDPDWGSLVWLTMTTGSRRGELCALRWSHVDLARGVVTIRRAQSKGPNGEMREKDTKTHQRRHVTIDPQTVAILTEHWERCTDRATRLGVTLSRTAFVFSLAPDGSSPLKPGSVTQRYGRLAARLGIDTHLHALRHYSATELIAAGVDVRTVAGRLGHAGGGATTLRVYAAWLAEVDQRAAAGLLARMPARPDPVAPAERAKTNPQSPAQNLAVQLRSRIQSGEYPIGGELPPMKQLSVDSGMAVGTVHRAVTLLKEWGLVEASRGRRARIVANDRALTTSEPVTANQPAPAAQSPQAAPTAELLDLEIRHQGQVFRRLSARADARDPDGLLRLLLGAIRRAGHDPAEVADYEMDVRIGGRLVTTFVDAGSL